MAVIPYRLLLVSERKPESASNIICSNHMIGWGLWEALAELPHVTRLYQTCEPYGSVDEWRDSLRQLPRVDFTLLHSYTPGPIFDEIHFLREKTSKEVMWISENTYYGVNHNFAFLSSDSVRPVSSFEQVALPCLKNVLESSERLERIPGSILLDHAYNMGEDWLWCKRLYEWLEPFKDSIVVGQMQREDHEKLAGLVIPDWVRKVPNVHYLEYLRHTSCYENYVMTHPGSYEHSIIDMAARGIRVLVPVKDGKSFAPIDTVQRLSLPTFSNQQEFFEQLLVPHDGRDDKAGLCSSMSDVAAQIDAHCQKVLNQ